MGYQVHTVHLGVVRYEQYTYGLSGNQVHYIAPPPLKIKQKVVNFQFLIYYDIRLELVQWTFDIAITTV